MISELKWLESLIDWRRMQSMQQSGKAEAESLREFLAAHPLPVYARHGVYGKWIAGFESDFESRLLWILSLCPHLDPTLLSNKPSASTMANLYSKPGKGFPGNLPTGLTFLFLATGNDLEKRWELMGRIARADISLIKEGKILIEPVSAYEPFVSGCLSVERDLPMKIVRELGTEPTKT